MPEPSGSEGDWPRLLVQQFSQHAKLYFKLANDVLRNSAAAEDAIQQAFLIALGRPTLRQRSALKGWLARIVSNESLSVRRRRQTERRILAEHFGRSAGADRLDRGWEIREATLDALHHLPDELREVVVLRTLNGMTGKEVAEILGCSDGQVSKLLTEGLEKLRKALPDRDGTSEKSDEHHKV